MRFETMVLFSCGREMLLLNQSKNHIIKKTDEIAKMKKAIIHKDNKGYILFPMATTVSGFSISADPKIRVTTDNFQLAFVENFIKVLNASQKVVPNPRPLTEEEKLESDKKLKVLGIKSYSSLNNKPVLACRAEADDDKLTLTPLIHDPSTKGKGYIKNEQSAITVNLKDDPNDILKAVENAFLHAD